MNTRWEPTILVVDDKQNMRSMLAKVLAQEGRVLQAAGGAQALALLERQTIHVVLCDLKMPDMDGLEVLRQVRQLSPQTEFVLMTAYASVATAVDAMRGGAYDYLQKPFDPDLAQAVVRKAAGRCLEKTPRAEAGCEILPDVLARSAAMVELGALVRKVADSDATVLILGETGTGKERIARAVHRLSSRNRFVAVNCAAIPAELLESELFGYSRGSFTGAQKDRAGLFEEAHRGTLFLDEIGDMRLSLQAKLTRVLEERAVRRLGESSERPVDVRLIAATHRELRAMVASRDFREDLWYRLNVATLSIPPLRARPQDISLLAHHFLANLPRRGRQLLGFSPAALQALEDYRWPGNVRQLHAAVERAALLCQGEQIECADLPEELRASPGAIEFDLSRLTWAQAQERARLEAGRAYLEQALRRFAGHVGQAAAHAGIERESFYRLMRRHGVLGGSSGE
jgi:two-component system response regulator HydG